MQRDCRYILESLRFLQPSRQRQQLFGHISICNKCPAVWKDAIKWVFSWVPLVAYLNYIKYPIMSCVVLYICCFVFTILNTSLSSLHLLMNCMLLLVPGIGQCWHLVMTRWSPGTKKCLEDSTIYLYLVNHNTFPGDEIGTLESCFLSD